MPAMDERSRSVARVLTVLEQLSVSPKPLSNQELAEALDVPASSMFRLLQKLVELGYAEFFPEDSSYAITPRLGALGVRLAEAGAHSLPLTRLVAGLRAATGHTIAVWVPNGVSVRISALLIGKIPGTRSTSPGEAAEAFSTPGLAIASQYSAEQVRAVVAQCRRRHVSLGRSFRRLAEIQKALEETRKRGYAIGYNMRSDGWAMLAWPILLSSHPPRLGALALGAQVAVLRRDEAQLVARTQRYLANYLAEQKTGSAPGAAGL